MPYWLDYVMWLPLAVGVSVCIYNLYSKDGTEKGVGNRCSLIQFIVSAKDLPLDPQYPYILAVYAYPFPKEDTHGLILMLHQD